MYLCSKATIRLQYLLSMYVAHLHTPLGWLTFEATEHALCRLQFGAVPPNNTPIDSTEWPPVLSNALAQMRAYLAGERTTFQLPLAPTGTPFQQKVWRLLQEIPFAETITYAALAERMGDPKTIRAVGTANGANPIPIIIPCHRVVGSNGKLVGYSGELWRKTWLIEHERQIAPTPHYQLF